jgi:hypothetical protein
MAEFHAPTDLELAEISRRTAQRAAGRLLAVNARYDRRAGRLVIELNTGVSVGFPLAALPGLERATPDDLRRIVVEGGGYGLHVPSLDADLSVPQLMADHLGATAMKVRLARALASQANGRKGGRPRKAG